MKYPHTNIILSLSCYETPSYKYDNILRILSLSSIPFVLKCAANILRIGSRKELFIRFTACAFRKLLSIYVFSYFPFGFEGRMWDLIVSVPDHCLSFYFTNKTLTSKNVFE